MHSRPRQSGRESAVVKDSLAVCKESSVVQGVARTSSKLPNVLLLPPGRDARKLQNGKVSSHGQEKKLGS